MQQQAEDAKRRAEIEKRKQPFLKLRLKLKGREGSYWLIEELLTLRLLQLWLPYMPLIPVFVALKLVRKASYSLRCVTISLNHI